ETMAEIQEGRIGYTAIPKIPRGGGGSGGESGNILTPGQVLAMHRTGRTPPIGSFIRLAGGVVEIGNTFKGEGYDNEKPVHRAKIPPLLISPYAVTNAEFRKFVEARGYSADRFWSEAGGTWKERNSIVQPREWDNARFNQPNQPVVGVSHYEAEAYLNWANSRFLTEHEWEYAARAGLPGKRYPWGDEAPSGKAHFDQPGDSGAAVEVNASGFAPNRFGLYHMAGNVWEWAPDWYADNYYQELASRGLVENPKGPENGSSRVIRGGSWGNTADFLRGSIRNYVEPGRRGLSIGFRAARTP
ncbi:MAG: formylglycine-generating enzyme family protein, partial [Candidatus Margulisbacteria bacterium]|nr:formylglycine-generating enzyme family protein [Candidatus Margulisiibacteriota bacterium]